MHFIYIYYTCSNLQIEKNIVSLFNSNTVFVTCLVLDVLIGYKFSNNYRDLGI